MAPQDIAATEAELPFVRLRMVCDGIRRIARFHWLHESGDEALDAVEDGHLFSPELDLMTLI
jgi:hypothetical protein